MKLSDFDFHLPDDLIAQVPSTKRDASQLMIVDRKSGTIRTDVFSKLGNYLKPNTVLTFNNSRVFPAKLFALKPGRKKLIEILLIRELEPNLWETLVKGLAKLKTGTQLTFKDVNLIALLKDKREGRGIIEFSGVDNLNKELKRIAQTPLPPYIKRDIVWSPESFDRERYQTVFATQSGSIAAPTAGLHFTTELLDTLRLNGLETLFLTLHVGPSTFQPVRCEKITNHRMQSEFYKISKYTRNQLVEAKTAGKNLLAVGTTTTRTLESIDLTSKTESDTSGCTNIFIQPGYHFNNVDQLLTNFHLPKSTLFMLVSAFGGLNLMKNAYRKAITERFRFYSYGDAMLIL